MSASVDSGILPDFGELARMALSWGRMAIWADDPLMQIVVNAVIIVVMMLSSAVGLLVGVPIAMVALVLLTVGVVRLIADMVM